MAGVSSGMSAASAAGLIQLGSDYDKRFRELNEQGDDGASAWPAFFEQLRDWLAACVQHGRFVPPGSADRRALQGQIDYWTSRLLQIGQSVRELDELERFDPNAGTPLPQELFPYYGLIAATEDSKHFFGRSEQIEEYASHLGERRSLLIQSESGGGKSSLAMAGVIPELRRRHPDWLFTPRITPGAHPQPALEKVLGVVLTQTTSMSTEAAMLAALGSRHLLIFIDQLEELLTLCTDESEQSEFCSLLASLAQSGHVRLLATLRSDHYDRLANSQACRSLFLLLIASNSVKMLLPMTFDQIRSVILKPAQAIGLRYIPASLVDRLANETANLAGGLPRLQFALQRLWELRPINDAGEGLDLINEATFAKLPSVREALATVAEGLFNSLLPNERNACQRLMLELTVLDDLLEVPLRRRRLEQDVIDILESAKFVDNAQGRDLVQKFIGQRLLLRTGSGQDAQLEVAHESLFRYWPRFQDWIRSDSTRVRLKDIRQIARDAQRWESAGGSADYLMLKGVPLEAARKYKEESWLDPASQRYYDACCSAEEQVKLLETKQASADQELKQARIAEGRAVALRKRVMRVAALICVLAGILTFVTLLWAHQVNLSQQAIVRAYAALPISNPLERLDLAYTLERDAPKRYASLLAQALDGLAGQELMGDRSTGIDFSTSGQALIQLFRIGNRLTVSIWPMEADGLHWPQPIKITVNESKEEQLFTVDVGPAMIAAKDKRFVVMWLVSQQSNSAPDRTFKKLVVYSVTKGDSEAHMLGPDYAFPPSTTQVSDVTFDRDGMKAVFASTQLVSPGKLQGSVVRLELNSSANVEFHTIYDSKEQPHDDVDNANVVSAVAFKDTGSGSDGLQGYVTGRFNGSVFCGEVPIKSPDPTPVISLQTTGDGPWFAALHASHALFVGSCQASVESGKIVQTLSTRPQSLALRVAESTDRKSNSNSSEVSAGQRAIQLSFTDNRRLCRATWSTSVPPRSLDINGCWNADLKIDQAIPLTGKSNSFAILPYPGVPLLMFRDGDSPREGQVDTALGLPVGIPARSDSKSLSATSPNGTYLVQIVASKDGRSFDAIQKRLGSPMGQSSGIQAPIAVAVNDQGGMALLESNRISIRRPERSKPESTPLTFEGACLKLTPDGQQALTAGRSGETRVFSLDGQPEQKGPQSPKAKAGEPFGSSVAACAISNDGDIVVGNMDGSVQYLPHAGAPRVLGALIMFHFPSAVEDVSIDATGRFVAALGVRAEHACSADAPGFPVRIWDMQRDEVAFPVASTCLPYNEILAIGSIENRAGNWVLPVFKKSGDQLQKIEYSCLACGDAQSSGASASILKPAESFSPRLLDRQYVRDIYGIDLNSSFVPQSRQSLD